MRELISVILEVLGLLLFAAAAYVALAEVHPALGLAGAAGVLIVEGFVVDLFGDRDVPKGPGETA